MKSKPHPWRRTSSSTTAMMITSDASKLNFTALYMISSSTAKTIHSTSSDANVRRLSRLVLMVSNSILGAIDFQVLAQFEAKVKNIHIRDESVAFPPGQMGGTQAIQPPTYR